MRAITFITTLTLLIFFNLSAQESIRGQLFNEVETLLAKVKTEKADILSPVSYNNGLKEYQRADADLKAGGNLDKIRQRIGSAKESFKKAIQFAVKSWNEAEKIFAGAMGQMEDDDLEDAKEEATEAETIYRKAELEAIEANLLSPARKLLKQAKEMDADDNAPLTFKKCETAIANAERSLKENRYDRDEARGYAKEAKYEAEHAIYLTKEIERLSKKDNAFEELILASEVPLNSIGNKLEVNLQFAKGLSAPTELILLTLDSLQISIENYQNVVLSQNNKVASLADQISLMENRLGEFTESEEVLRQKIAQKNEQEQKIKTIAQTITRAEGQVLLDGDNVVIRLYGLNFPSGKSTIKPEFFGLLKKVQNGIASFDNCKVIIEGHTDSRGSDNINQKLSNERADAVMQYIIANMDFAKERIEAKGYGETKPVANNETEAGRAKNRRIDVIIIPAWAQK